MSRRSTFAVLAMVSGSLVCAEVLITRLLSLAAWYGLVFMVLSLAMLGMARGGLDAERAQRDGVDLATFVEQRLLAMSVGLALTVVVLCVVPISFGASLGSVASLLVAVAVIAVPFVSGGAIVARLLSDAGAGIARLYAADLVAAAAGALVPLAILGPLSGPSALLAVAAAIALTCLWLAPDARRRTARIVAMVTIAMIAVTEASPSTGLVVMFPKGAPRPSDPAFEAWNPLSHVLLPAFRPSHELYLWSPSPVAPTTTTVLAAHARIDGEAGTPTYGYHDVSELDFLRYDATTVAHALRHEGTACVIGVGGGRDLISALLYGHPRVIGAEINPSMLHMLDYVSDVSPTLRDPRVELVIGDGREVFAAREEQCTVLQASLVDTWAATTAGAFAHTEATIYTREAWATFLHRVEPNGIFTCSRWYDPARPSETSRLLALGLASLHDRGVVDPTQHVAIVAAGPVATILVSPAPFSEPDVRTLRALVDERQYTLLVGPGSPPADPLMTALLEARSTDALAEAGRPLGLDTSAPTDDRPFFFHFLTPAAWLHPADILRASRGTGVLSGNIAALFQLFLCFLATSIVAAVLLGPTLRDAWRGRGDALAPRAIVYFAALGAGFMLAEIALVQRMHVVLGHPTYALVIVLTSLLVATGIGSLVSGTLVRSPRAVSIAAALVGLALVALPHVVISPLAASTLHASLAVRAAWTASCAACLGVGLGLFFPSGVRYLAHDRGASLALAINGASSVLGSVAAMLVSVWFGIAASFALAGALYLVAAATGPMRWRAKAAR